MKKRYELPLERKGDTMLNWKRASCLMVALLTSFAAIGCADQPIQTRVEKEIAVSKPGLCENALPIYINSQDVITDDTAKQILVHNKTGRKLCKW